MKSRFLVWVLAMGTWGCSDSTVKVLADPWLQPLAQEVADRFTASQADWKVEIKAWSSEQATRMIRMGEPVDVFFFLDRQSLVREGIQSWAMDSVVLGSERMALLRARTTPMVGPFGTDTCVAVPVPYRPQWRAMEDWFASDTSLSLPKCQIPADFARQEQEYLLRGWVPLAIGPENFGLRHPEQVDVLREGPLLPHWYLAVSLQKSPHPEGARAFLDFLRKEISSKTLANRLIIP